MITVFLIRTVGVQAKGYCNGYFVMDTITEF